MLQNLKANKQRSSRRKSAPLMSVETIALLPRFELAQFFLYMNDKQHVNQKSQHQNATFLCI